MKRFSKILLLFILLFTTVTVNASSNIPLRINGKNQNLSMAKVVVNNNILKSSYSPYISGGRTFVPIRELTESLGADVNWNNKNKTADIILNNTKITLKIDSPIVYVNGKELHLHKHAIPRLALYKNTNETKTMVPLRFLSETFGFDVSWDQKTKTAKIHGSNPVSLSNEENTVNNKPKQELESPSNVINSNEVEQKEERVITKKIKAQGPVTIVIDAGHGGKDPGATAIDGKTTEKELNLMVTRALAPKLRACGYEVIETRTTDEFIELAERAEIAERENAEIFVSIHFNSSSSDKASGIEVLYAPESKVEIKEAEQVHLAKCILDEVIKETGAKSRGVKARADLAVLRKTSMPAALAELGFMSNDNEFGKISTPEYFNKLVEGVSKGIQKYVNNYVE
ncbi:MAG: N-acetylmuramoyl-L-alanine amidase [Tissierellia bacterium]|nr:N-acetylmuramoyl-L-alanine amidase [Tissierellia bacterium]